MKNNKKNKIIIVIGIVILSVITSIFYNTFYYTEKYSVNLNLMFNLDTKYNWNFIGQRYENIIRLYNTKEKEASLVSNALNDMNIKGNNDKVKINPDVFGRQINIQYIAKNKENGIKVVEAVGDSIIKSNKEFIPNKMVGLNKNLSINEEDIIIDKRLNILIFAICGLAVGLGIVMIMEGKCLLKKK